MSAVPTNVGVFFGQVDKGPTQEARSSRTQSEGRSSQRNRRLKMRFRTFEMLQVMGEEKGVPREYFGRRK
jgi:hypothetical protein